MFEGKDIITQILNHKKEFLTFKIIHHCVKCGKMIDTFWNGYTIEGNFISGDAWWSDALDTTVDDPNNIICYDCLGNKRASDERMRRITYGK